MRVARILGPQARFYDRKSFLCDSSEGAGSENWTMSDNEEAIAQPGGPILSPKALAAHFNGQADLVHIYGAVPVPLLRALTLPVLFETPQASNGEGWWSRLRSRAQPEKRASPSIPEAVEDSFFRDRSRPRLPRVRIGSLGGGRDLIRMIELSITRFSRFRDDIDWDLFDEPPSPEILDELSLWVDPTVDEDDRDGFVAEALVAGLPIVASVNRANVERLQNGACGFLVPPDDPNELVHASLTALFKDEIAQPRLIAAHASRDRFRSSNRAEALKNLFEGMVP